jgi:hypothetical protein
LGEQPATTVAPSSGGLNLTRISEDPEQARAAVIAYIDVLYTRKRCRQTLGSVTTLRYEERAGDSQHNICEITHSPDRDP